MKKIQNKRKSETEVFNNILKNISCLNDDYSFEDKEKHLTKKEVDVILSSLDTSEEWKPCDELSKEEEKAFKKAKEIKKFFPEYKMTQFGILDQELLSKMTYQSYLGIRFSDKKKDVLLKQFNRRIVRNYILCAILGGLVVGGVVMGPKIVKDIRQTVIEKNFEQER